MNNSPMHDTLARENALEHQATDPMAAAARLERERQNTQRLNRRIHTLANRRKEPAATKLADRSTLDEVAAWLGVSRSAVSRLLEEPLRPGRHQEGAQAWVGKRHDHGTGRRRRAGAGSWARGSIRRPSPRMAYIVEAAS